MTEQTRGIVLVGRRNGAIRAAKALGARYAVLATPCDEGAVAALHTAPAAVIALTEAAVLPAAQLRERFGLPGLDVATATRCTDKLAMKRAIEAAGIPCTRYQPVSGALDRPQLLRRLGLPLVLKTQTGSGSRGAQVVRHANQLPTSLPGPYLAEAFVDGVEMSVESFVVDGAPVFTNFSRYVEPRWANQIPALLAPDQRAAVLRMNRDAIAALGVRRGITHLEVFLTAGGVVFGELAARPPGGHLMRLLELAYGFDPWRTLLQIELGARPALPQSAVRSAGVRFVYPDAGVVRSIGGVDAVRTLPSTVEVLSTLSPGERIAPRESTGQHRGFAIFAGPAEQVGADLEQARTLLKVEVDSGD